MGVNRPVGMFTESISFVLLVSVVLIFYRWIQYFPLVSKELFRSSTSSREIGSNRDIALRHQLPFFGLMNLVIFSYISMRLVLLAQGNSFIQSGWIFGKVFLLVTAFGMLKYVLYYLTGTVFFSKDITSQWLTLNQLLLTFFLVAVIPVILIVQNHHSFTFEEASGWLMIGLIAEKCCCVALRRKIFLTNPYSYIYLILYLCTLEILPVLLLIKGLYLVSQ